MDRFLCLEPVIPFVICFHTIFIAGVLSLSDSASAFFFSSIGVDVIIFAPNMK